MFLICVYRGGAQTAPSQSRIELCAGAQENTDQAVESYFKKVN